MRYVVVAATETAPAAGLFERIGRSLGWPARTFGRHAVFADEDELLLPVSGGRGLVIGAIYRPGARCRVRELDPPGEADPAAFLLERHHGAYVAALPRHDGLGMLRDPSGALPCLSFRADPLTLFASDLEALEASGLWVPRIDMAAVGRTLYTVGLPEPRTALVGVEEVLPGTEVVAGPHQLLSVSRWSPWQFADAGAFDRSMNQAAQLGLVVRDAVAAATQGRQRLLLGVSGGLDSSIVASATPEARQRLVCFTLTTRDAHGDERRHARRLCEHLGLTLVERWYSPDAQDLLTSAASHRPRPSGRTPMVALAKALADLAQATGADAFLSGHGGDNVFAYSQSAIPVVDRWRAEGASWNVLATIRDVSRLTGAGAGAVIRSAWRRARRPPGVDWLRRPGFLNADVVAAAEEAGIEHPWLQAPERASLGKLAHVASILRAQVHADGVLPRSNAASMFPLLDQKVVEFCLGMPSWWWCEGGFDRALARSAFTDALPAAILRRRSKGSPDGHSRSLLELFKPLVRERLLGGRLSAAGLLDRAALEPVLAARVDMSPGDRSRLFSLVDAEAWLDHWSGTTRRVQSAAVTSGRYAEG